MYADFERFTIRMTKEQARACSHPGACDQEVKDLSELPAIMRQIAKISPDDIRAELAECGAWDEVELADHDQNVQRILWIAAGNIREEAGLH